MTSVLNVDTIADKAGTGPVELTKQSAAKAWSNLNGSTFGLRDSFNVSSATDNATGQYTISFSNSFDVTTYSANTTSLNRMCGVDLTNMIAASCKIRMVDKDGNDNDSDQTMSNFHGDLA